MSVFIQGPTYGSKWYRGNFAIGLLVDNHPAFLHIILSLWFVEIGVSWNRKDATTPRPTPGREGEC